MKRVICCTGCNRVLIPTPENADGYCCFCKPEAEPEPELQEEEKEEEDDS